MNDQLSNFFEAMKATDIGTKVVIAISAVALIGAIAVVGVVSNEEHFEVAFAGLTDGQFAAVSAAIAQAGIDMETYRGDGRSSILTRKSDIYKAKGAAFLASAISVQDKGILGNKGGTASVFAGMAEREQITREKEMSEIEKTIEELDFVTRAELVMPKTNPSALRASKKESVSMVVRTVGGRELSGQESASLAKMLQGALDIPMEKIVITDQAGRLIHGGVTEDASGIDGRALEMQREYNRLEEERINAFLAKVYGIDKARVMVSSEFDFTQSTVISRQSGKPVTISERKLTTNTPLGSTANDGNGGGIAGASSNVASSGDNWDDPNAAVVTGANGSAVPASAKTEETETASFIPTIDTTEIHNQPRLKRLSISLTLDDSLAGKMNAIGDSVKAMLSFDETRNDTFNAITTAIEPTPVIEAPDAPEGEAMPEEGGGMATETLIENGVEIVSAMAFIFLLLKGLKGSKKTVQGSAAAAAAGTKATKGAKRGDLAGIPDGAGPAEVSPEVLARAQVDDLVQNNPERVAQILSNWVVEGRSPVKS